MALDRVLQIILKVLGIEEKAKIDEMTAAVERLNQAQTATGAGPAATPSGDAAGAAEAQAAATEKVTAALAGEEAALGQVAAAQAVIAPAATAASETEVQGATAATAATEAQAAATVNLETILQMKARIAQEAAQVELDADARVAEAHLAAAFAMQKLAEATAVGGKQMAAALLEARNAVASLEVAITSAQAAGAPVSPATIAALAAYDQQVAALSITTEKATSSTKVLGAEAALMRDNAAGAARAVASMGGSAATAALGIGVAVVAMDLIPTIIDKIDSKSKELASSLVSLIDGLHEEDAATKKAGESWQTYEDRVQKVLDSNQKLTLASIAMGAGLIREQTDREKAIVAIEAYEFALHGVIEQFPELQKAAEKMGISFKATHEQMAAEAEVFFNLYKGELLAGQGNATAWAEANKSSLDKIVSYYERAGEQVPPRIKAIADSIGLVSAAEKEAAKDDKLAKHLDDESVAYARLGKSVEDGTKELGSYAAAAAANHAEIDRQIEQLNKQQGSEKGLTDVQRDRLNALIVLHAEISALAPEQEKLNKANDDAKKAIIALGQEELKLTAAYEKGLAAIREHAAAQIAAADSELKKIQASADGQIAALTKLHADGDLSNEEYSRKVAELQNAEVDARRATEVKEDLINKEKVQSENDATEKFTEATAKVKAQLDERNTDLAHAEQAAKDFATANKASTDAIAAEAAKIAETVTTRKGYESSIKDMGTAIGGTDKALGNLITKHDAHSEGLRSKYIPAVGDFGTKLEGVAGTSVPKLETALDRMVLKLELVRLKLGEVGSAATTAFGTSDGGGAPTSGSTADAGTGATPGSEGG